MELITRYVAEVGRHLPEKTRRDVEQEIRSLVEDALDDHARKESRPADEEMLVAVLKEFGPPEKMAASYQPERYLIGPRLYPGFITVIKIALPIILILSAVGLAFRIGQPGFTLADFFTALADFFGTALQVLGNVVLVFAILERAVPGLKLPSAEKEWDPRSLPKPAPDPAKVGVVGLSFEMAVTMIALVIFNFYPHIIGFNYLADGKWMTIPILAEVFFTRYLPWLNLIWGAQIVLNAVLIGRGRWDTVTSGLSMAVKLGNILLAVAMLTGPSLIGMTAEDLAVNPALGAGTAGILVSLITQVVRGALWLVVILESVDVVKLGWRMITGRRAAAEPVQG